jgi:transcription initiation factor TFIIB
MELDAIWRIVDELKSDDDSTSTSSLSDEYFCQRCGGVKAMSGCDDHGILFDLPTCTACGATDDFYICPEAEWRTGAEHEGPDPCRVGAPENLDHYSQAWNIGTLIKHGPNVNRLIFRQLHSNVNHKDRSLWLAYNDMDRIGQGVLNLPVVVMYDAKIKYRKFNENVLTRGAVRSGIKANCIFQACREHNIARTVQEIADAFNIPAKDLSRTFDMFKEQNPETKVHIIRPADLIPRFFNSVKSVPDAQRGRIRMKMVSTCEQLEQSVKLAGRTPKAVACAVMHVMLAKIGFPVSKTEICKICDVSGPTLAKIEMIIKSELTV